MESKVGDANEMHLAAAFALTSKNNLLQKYAL